MYSTKGYMDKTKNLVPMQNPRQKLPWKEIRAPGVPWYFYRCGLAINDVILYFMTLHFCHFHRVAGIRQQSTSTFLKDNTQKYQVVWGKAPGYVPMKYIFGSSHSWSYVITTTTFFWQGPLTRITQVCVLLILSLSYSMFQSQ